MEEQNDAASQRRKPPQIHTKAAPCSFTLTYVAIGNSVNVAEKEPANSSKNNKKSREKGKGRKWNVKRTLPLLLEHKKVVGS